MSILPELFPAVAKAIGWFIPFLDRHGLLAETPGWIFIDWSEKLERRGEVLVLNALFAAALRAGARVAELVDAPHYLRRWEALSAAVAASANERFWDGERGIYADARTVDGLSATASQQGNAAAIAFGVAPAERMDSVFRAILDHDTLKLTRTWKWDVDRPFDPDKDIILAQPCFSHFLHVALDTAHRVGDIVANIKNRWSPMLRDGGTFWETWQVTEMTSRCHAFSATPTYDLSTYVLGVKPVADGYSQFRIAPYLQGLAWARGEVPTPAGMISVAWRWKGKTVEVDVGVPTGLAGKLTLDTIGAAEDRFRLLKKRRKFKPAMPAISRSEKPRSDRARIIFGESKRFP
jgi:hypothetical protein